jgi:hypothetical protein
MLHATRQQPEIGVKSFRFRSQEGDVYENSTWFADAFAALTISFRQTTRQRPRS